MSPARLRKLSDEAYVAEGPVVHVAQADIEALKRLASSTRRGRVRILAHPDVDDLLHEMLIVHTLGSYIRPHKHPGKSESGHVLEGSLDLIFFDEEGDVREVVELGGYRSGRAFYYRVDEPLYHTVLLRTDLVVIHEVTNGPFSPDDTVFARWAPDENDDAAREAFQRRLVERVESNR